MTDHDLDENDLAVVRKLVAMVGEIEGKGGVGVPLEQRLFAALALNRVDWLTEQHYSIGQALQRIGPEWAAYLPEVARRLQ